MIAYQCLNILSPATPITNIVGNVSVAYSTCYSKSTFANLIGFASFNTSTIQFALSQAQNQYNTIMSLTECILLPNIISSPTTLVPNCYYTTGSFIIESTLNINCNGNPNGQFYFQINGFLLLTINGMIQPENACNNGNLYWAVNGNFNQTAYVGTPDNNFIGIVYAQGNIMTGINTAWNGRGYSLISGGYVNVSNNAMVGITAPTNCVSCCYLGVCSIVNNSSLCNGVVNVLGTCNNITCIPYVNITSACIISYSNGTCLLNIIYTATGNITISIGVNNYFSGTNTNTNNLGQPTLFLIGTNSFTIYYNCTQNGNLSFNLFSTTLNTISISGNTTTCIGVCCKNSAFLNKKYKIIY